MKKIAVIRPFASWAAIYDPKGARTVSAYIDGVMVRIPYSMARVMISYYHGRIFHRDEERKAWFELPQEPYVLKYLQVRERIR